MKWTKKKSDSKAPKVLGPYDLDQESGKPGSYAAIVPTCFKSEKFFEEQKKWESVLRADAAEQKAQASRGKRGDDFYLENLKPVSRKQKIVPRDSDVRGTLLECMPELNELGSKKGRTKFQKDLAIKLRNKILDPLVMNRLSRFIDWDRAKAMVAREQAENSASSNKAQSKNEPSILLHDLFLGDAIELPLKEEYKEINVRDFGNPPTSDFERKLRSDWTDEDRRFADKCGGTLIRKNSLDSYLLALRLELNFKYPSEVFPEQANICIRETEDGPVLRFHCDTVDLAETVAVVHPYPKVLESVPTSVLVSAYESRDKDLLFQHFGIDANPIAPTKLKTISPHAAYKVIPQLMAGAEPKLLRLLELYQSGLTLKQCSSRMLSEEKWRPCSEETLRKMLKEEFHKIGLDPEGHNSRTRTGA
jgi:hypothetical protein